MIYFSVIWDAMAVMWPPCHDTYCLVGNRGLVNITHSPLTKPSLQQYKAETVTSCQSGSFGINSITIVVSREIQYDRGL